jgi:hypothetical protein
MSDVINAANNTLSFTILQRCVRTRHLKVGAMCEQKGSCGGVVKLAPIVSLDGLDCAAELGGHISEEI